MLLGSNVIKSINCIVKKVIIYTTKEKFTKM